MVVGLTAILLGYISLLIWMLWKCYPSSRITSNVSSSSSGIVKNQVSVLIAIKDGQTEIERLVGSLENQSIPGQSAPIIIIDDHSNPPLQNHYNTTTQGLQIHRSPNPQGKKHALAYGVTCAETEYLLFTDADCMPVPDWIESTLALLNKHHETDLLIQPVWIDGGNSVFAQLQSMEFASIMAATLFAARVGHPTLCNGANLACRRERYLQFLDDRTDLHIPSGDDMFLLEYARRNNWNIQYQFGPKVTVLTMPLPSFKAFWHQRLRWAGKWKHYESDGTRFATVATWLLHLALVGAQVLCFSGYSIILLPLLFTKAIGESLLIFSLCKRLSQPFFLLPVLLLQLVYSPYVIAIGLISTIRGK